MKHYNSSGGASQLYARDPAGAVVEVLTINAGRTTRVLQSVKVISDSSISLTGTIRLGDGRTVEARGLMTVISGTKVRLPLRFGARPLMRG